MNEGIPKAEEPQPVLTVGITYNLRQWTDDGDDRYEEYDSIETISSLETEIRKIGFSPLRLEQDEHFLETLSRIRPDFVLNIAEGRGGGRGRESQVPCVLARLGIPFTGSDPVALALTLDKHLTRTVLAAEHLPVPEGCMISPGGELSEAEMLLKRHGKVIVKPRWEGSSKGVFADSTTTDAERLPFLVSRIWERYAQAALVEEYLPGDEYTVSLLGNPPEAVGLMRIRSDRYRENFLYSLENKRDPDWMDHMVYEGRSALEPSVTAFLENRAVRAFEVLELRDLARIDFRTDVQGVPRIIDVNPLPGLRPGYSDFPISCGVNGVAYDDIIRGLFDTALRRCGLLEPFRLRVAS